LRKVQLRFNTKLFSVARAVDAVWAVAGDQPSEVKAANTAKSTAVLSNPVNENLARTEVETGLRLTGLGLMGLGAMGLGAMGLGEGGIGHLKLQWSEKT
jgi:hypothetical protein